MCPYCQAKREEIKKKGFYSKQSTRAEKIQRYLCKVCQKSFSPVTGSLNYREKKPHLNQKIYRLLCSGMSQTRISSSLGTRRVTVANKIQKLSRFARRDELLWSRAQSEVVEVQFDELETFEHTKYKPVSVGIAVNPKTREVVGAFSASMPAKGLLAKGALKKYGPRVDNRKHAMRQLMERIKSTYGEPLQITTDKKSSYRPLVKTYFPKAFHMTCKGKRGCVVGQGELKATHFDPLFMLNHTYAMFRDNLKTLTRRTWCTVKKLCRFQDLLDLYVHFHNRFVVQRIRVPKVCGDPIT